MRAGFVRENSPRENVDAKIASKAIALRIKKVIGKLVHCDQTAYVGNRNIGKSVRLISDILEYTDENDIEAILFSADFEKAWLGWTLLHHFHPQSIWIWARFYSVG